MLSFLVRREFTFVAISSFGLHFLLVPLFYFIQYIQLKAS